MENILAFKESLITLSKKIEEGAITRVIDISDIKQAQVNIKNMALNTIDDYFLYFSSINLVNAYVKKEYSTFKQYDFKQFVAKGIDALISEPVVGIRFSYNKQLTIVEIAGIQFSFHNSSITELMKQHTFEEVTWEGLRLQPVALEIYNYAKNLCNLSNKSMYGGSLSDLYIKNSE